MTTDDELYEMDREEFRAFANTTEFYVIPGFLKFNLVWLRLSSFDRRFLFQLYRDNAEEKILASEDLKKQIYDHFSEAKLVSAKIEVILKVIREFYDPNVPLHFYK